MHCKISKWDLLIHKFYLMSLLSSTRLAKWKSRGKMACKEEHE